MMNILLTGGAGYIGSHTAVALLEAGHHVVIIDNFYNSQRSVIQKIEQITGKKQMCIEADIANTPVVLRALQENQIDVVIHFAGLKSVGESVQNPLAYYANNITGTISLFEAMKTADVKVLVFSSSATVYGDPLYLPIDEKHPLVPMSPYGRTKLQIEEMLKDMASSDPTWKIICLRYFNPVGAHDSGLIGEDPQGIPNNLTPYVARVASGILPQLQVFGGDYPTADGTGVRDYIHIMDLAEGHLAALNFVNQNPGWVAVNLGTGEGHSVLEVIHAYEVVVRSKIPFEIVDRRPGDIASCFAKVDCARELLQWVAKRGLTQMCESSWKFQCAK